MRATAAAMLALVCGPAMATGQAIPVRQLSAAEAVLPGKYDIRTMIRPLSDGGMILSARRQVVRFPASFTNPTIVIDSTSALLGRATFGVVLVQALGDTTWVVDVNTS